MTSDKQFAACALTAQEGTSYTDACWHLRKTAAPPAAPTGQARYGWQQITIDALSAVVAEHGVVPVRVIWSEEPRRPTAGHNTERWGVAEPAANGYVIREVPSAMWRRARGCPCRSVRPTGG